MRAAWVWAALALQVLQVLPVRPARILAVLPTNTRSHYAMYGRVLEALALRRHHLTVVSHFNMKTSLSNVAEISLAGSIKDLTNDLSTPHGLRPQFMTNLDQIIDECVESCEKLAENDGVKALLNSTARFDLVIVEVFGTECALGFAHHFGVPVVGLLSSVPLPWVNDQIGNPDNPAYIPSYFMGFGQNMNFWQRFLNTYSLIYAKIAYRIKSQITSQKYSEKLFGQIPPLTSLAENYSLILSNSHFSINDVRPLIPSIVEVGGLHLDNSQELPKHLKQMLDNSSEKVIYWSFGSMSRIETIPARILSQIFQVFSELPHKIVIKMDLASLPANVTVPDNVHAQKWMPQHKTLCHPNVNLFISHGGLLGVQEAVACAVPVLFVPLYADQALNARAIADRGAALVLRFDTVTEDSWRWSVTELLSNPKYKERMMALSNVFLDRPTSAVDSAVYWVEYVLRHKGAAHLRSPALALNTYQYLLLDVVAFSIIIVLALVASVLMLIRILKRKEKKI